MYLFALQALAVQPWLVALADLHGAFERRDQESFSAAYSALYAALVEGGAANLAVALAQTLLWTELGVARAALSGDVPAGLRRGFDDDLNTLLPLIRRDWQSEAQGLWGRSLPPLDCLAQTPKDDAVSWLAELLRRSEADEIASALLSHYQQHGAGILARYQAFRWQHGELVGVAHPARVELDSLVDLERPKALLKQNTEAFLAGKPAQHMLLYGARGSGKSTAVKALLPRYARRGLRLIELAPSALKDLPDVLETLRTQPQYYILFVDDLSFESDDTGYAPLKTLLEGSLTARPDNVLVCATSNRRHLVRERFADRPDPLDDDVHAWDTQHERLALADRFGLTITFPDATQKRYLNIVQELAEREGLVITDLETKAIRYADWGNGYSGRTAQQFIEKLLSES